MRAAGPFSPVVVAGGASGIGRATCMSLAEHGRPVAVWDVQYEAAKQCAEEAADRFNVRAEAFHVNLRDTDSMAAGLEATVGSFGTIGALAYVAGYCVGSTTDTMALDEWDPTLEINLRGAAILTRLMLPRLREAAPEAAIVIVGSSVSFFGSPNAPAYCAAKAGALGLTRSLGLALAPDRIRVNIVCPGATDTPMHQSGLASTSDPEGARATMKAHIPLKRIADPAELAAAIRFLLSNDASYITGTSLMVDGGMTSGF